MSTALYPQGATLNGKHYTAKQIWIITKIQAHMRMYMAKKKVSMIRNEVYPHGMHDMHYNPNGEDFENINVQVSGKVSRDTLARCRCRFYFAQLLTLFVSLFCRK